MELSDGTTGYLILANDSSKTIEAFHFNATCKRTDGGMGGSTSAEYDKLWTSSTVGPAARGHDGRPIGPQPDVIAPGQRMQTLTDFSQPEICAWKPDIDAVIYFDGTYEGSNNGVRSLQIWRDGFADELQYWSTKLHPESSTPFDPYAISREAEWRAEWHMGRPEGLLNDYQSGRGQVDRSLSLLAYGNPPPDELHRSELDLIDRWKKKLDDDVAFKKMNAIFPPPAEVITVAPPMLAPPAPARPPFLH